MAQATIRDLKQRHYGKHSEKSTARRDQACEARGGSSRSCGQVAALGFGAAAWQVAPRDQFIGWSHDQRQNKLALVVNNTRFLIMPWVQSKNLASKILAMVARRLPEQWEQCYRIRPVLLETFVDTERFTGACYKAANWIYVGKTKGRGKLGPAGKQSVPIKAIWLYPLCRQFKAQPTNRTNV